MREEHGKARMEVCGSIDLLCTKEGDVRSAGATSSTAKALGPAIHPKKSFVHAAGQTFRLLLAISLQELRTRATYESYVLWIEY